MLIACLLHVLRCPVFRRLREEAEKRKRPSWNELKGRKGDGESAGEAKHSASLPRNASREPEPGLINPAYEESEDGTHWFPHSCQSYRPSRLLPGAGHHRSVFAKAGERFTKHRCQLPELLAPSFVIVSQMNHQPG